MGGGMDHSYGPKTMPLSTVRKLVTNVSVVSPRKLPSSCSIKTPSRASTYRTCTPRRYLVRVARFASPGRITFPPVLPVSFVSAILHEALWLKHDRGDRCARVHLSRFRSKIHVGLLSRFARPARRRSPELDRAGDRPVERAIA
jgi:hypothetical protein